MNTIKPKETVYNGYRFRSRLEARWAVFFDALKVNYEYESEGFDLPSGNYYLPDFRIKCYGTRGSNWAFNIGTCENCIHRISAISECTIQQFDNWCDLYDHANRCFEQLSIPDWMEIRDKDGSITACKKYEPREPDCFDLYVEVKGEMKQKDADKIIEFAKEYPVLIVGDIPNPIKYTANSDDLHCYDRMSGIDIYPWNYYLIDGDCYGAYPAVDAAGHFYLDGDDSHQTTVDPRIICNAFKAARQARFEHGEHGAVSCALNTAEQNS